jgi:hypothetical protein
VFEQAKYGDLEKFMETNAGRNLSVESKLSFLSQIVSVVDLLHHLGMFNFSDGLAFNMTHRQS